MTMLVNESNRNQCELAPNSLSIQPGWRQFPFEPLSPSETEEFLKHLGVSNAFEPTKANLDALIKTHLKRVPYENLDRLLHGPVQLEADALLEKVLERGRGGSCQELNSLFGRLLLALGYRLQLRSARYSLDIPNNAQTRMNVSMHLVLLVNIPDDNNRYLVDVASGIFGIHRALPLKGDARPFRVRYLDPPNRLGTVEVSTPSTHPSSSDGWKVIYSVDPGPRYWIDFTAINWFTGTHPDSIMKRKLIVGRMTRNGSWLRLVNNKLCQLSLNGFLEATKTLRDECEIIESLQRDFGISLGTDRNVQQLMSCLRKLQCSWESTAALRP